MDNRARFPWWLVAVNGVIAFAITVGTIEFWHARIDDAGEELRMLRLVYRQVLRDHVEPHDSEAVQRGAIAWLMGQLDEYSAFVPPDKATAFDSETTGEYQGIGLVPVPRTAPLTVHWLFEGGPAERAGLAVGDRIVAIDGEPLAEPADKLVAAATRRLLGQPGSTVAVRVERAGGGTADVVITRAAVQRRSVKWARLLDPQARLGYVHVATFQQRTTAELDQDVQQLADLAGGALAGLVLDLRHNPGGLLAECVAVANRFLAAGNIVTLRARGNVEQGRHDADPAKATHPALPLVVLVNEDSASASEVLSGALQDHARAVLVGERTFGKGAVQSIYRWEGLDFRLKLTTSHYHTPSGRNIGPGKGGIVPDVEVALPRETAATVAARLGQYQVPARYRAAAAELGRKLGFVSEHEQLGPEEDEQLGRALAELRAMLGPRNGNPR